MGRNPYNGYKYLCGATPTGVFLMQWYDPLNKFMLLKHFECSIANPPRIFEMIITPDLEYPIVCVNVRRGFDGRYVFSNPFISQTSYLFLVQKFHR